ncbi:MAG: arylesterase [Alphaproteobacteria bacterium]|nr:arylesterase [Alphaproteobacteria bacterium]
MNIKQTVVCLLIFLCAGLSPCAALAEKIEIVALGDSLTAGYQLAPGDAFPVRLEAELKARGHDVSVLNAGVSGDTSTGALSRFDWAVPESADIVIVELGANDALRGVDPAKTRDALNKMLERLEKNGAETLLAGMIAPPNMGEDYAEQFNPMYAELAKQHGVALYPFFLEGVAARPELNQADGMHPNRKGIDIIVRNIVPHVESLIVKRKSK